MKRAIIPILALAIILGGCAPLAGEGQARVYYEARSSDIIGYEIVDLPETADTVERVRAIFEAMKQPTDIGIYRNAIPRELELKSVMQIGSTLILNVSEQYGKMSGLTRSIADACITLSMCELSDVASISITIDGIPANERDDAIKPDDIITSGMGIIKFEKEISLYFVNSDYSALVLETRRTISRENESDEHIVISALMDGSSIAGAHSPFPSGTVLNSIYTENGVCYLNLSKEFLKASSDYQMSEMMTVYAVVNSLTALPDIERVQFLIDGVKTRGFTHFDLSKPIEVKGELS